MQDTVATMQSDSEACSGQAWRGRGKGRRHIFLAECQGKGAARGEASISDDDALRRAHVAGRMQTPTRGTDAQCATCTFPSDGEQGGADVQPVDDHRQVAAPSTGLFHPESTPPGATGTLLLPQDPTSSRTWEVYEIQIDGCAVPYYHDALSGVTTWHLPDSAPSCPHRLIPGRWRPRWTSFRTVQGTESHLYYHDFGTGETTWGRASFHPQPGAAGGPSRQMTDDPRCLAIQTQGQATQPHR